MPLFLPILAQTIAIGVSDRTELRYVVQPDARSFQAETRAGASLALAGRNTGLTLSYSPALYVAPLMIPIDNLTILQDAGINGYVGFQFKRHSVSLSQSVNYNQVNYALVALSARPSPTGPAPTEPVPTEPAPAPDTPGTPDTPTTTPGSEAPSQDTLHYLTATTSATVGHQLSRRATLGEFISYSYHRALGDVTEQQYPSNHGISTGIGLSYALSRRDSTSSGLTGNYTWSTTGARALIIGFSQGYNHAFSRNASGGLAAGVGYSRGIAADGRVEDGIGAILGANYTVTVPAASGVLTARIAAGYAPAIDPSTTAINPRLGISGGVSWWNRGRLTLSANSSATLSAEPDEGGAIQNVAVDLGMSYVLGAGFNFASGVRGAWTTFEKVEVLPPTAVAYVALTWGATLLNTADDATRR